MNRIANALLSSEFLVGAFTFLLGYLAHLRSVKEAKSDESNRRETTKMHLYELELQNLTHKQVNIQTYMEKSILRLESERETLYQRISDLEYKIDQLEDEVLDWRTKYIDALSSCDS